MKRGNQVGRWIMVLFLTSLLACVIPSSIFSQEKYPEKPITILLGWNPGGQADVFTRLLANGATKILGQPVVVENRPGAHGMIAAHTVVKSKPDGYTLAGGVSSQFLVASNMQKIDFNPMNDPTQIMTFLHYDLGLVVRSDSPWKTWDELKTYAKQNPGKVRYSSAAVGGMQHIIFEMIAQKEGIKWIHIPFPSGNGPVLALLGGHVEFTAQAPADVVPHVESGSLRFLLALNDRRWPIAPNIPHIGELGYDNAFSYFSIWGPKGLPEPLRLKLENAFHEAMKDPSFADAARKLQVTIVYIGGKEYSKMLKERFPKYQKIVKDLGLEAK